MAPGVIGLGSVTMEKKLPTKPIYNRYINYTRNNCATGPGNVWLWMCGLTCNSEKIKLASKIKPVQTQIGIDPTI